MQILSTHCIVKDIYTEVCFDQHDLLLNAQSGEESKPLKMKAI